MNRKPFRHLASDEKGATLVEFAFVAPVLCAMLVGLFDIGFNIYAQSLMQGAMQEAARDSTLEPGLADTVALDDAVEEQIQRVVPNSVITFERKNYFSFEDINRPEDFTDGNGNLICDDGEPFDDVNGNGVWDTDRGASGQGGARDAVLYTVTASYDRLFPLHKFINVNEEITVKATTVLRNQPFDEQAQRVIVEGHCT